MEGGSITVFWQEFYNGYDPSIADNRNYALWFDRLWSPDWNSSREDYQWDSEYITMDYMIGQIADSWSFDSEAMALSVTIRDDVYFQEKTGDLAQYDVYGGRQLTAEDVAWSYQRLLGLDGVARVRERTGLEFQAAHAGVRGSGGRPEPDLPLQYRL